MNLETIGGIFFGIGLGMAILLFIFTQWARPLVRKERISAMKHHVFQVCTYIGDQVYDSKITPKEAELILRVALVAVCRGNKKMTHYLHHVEMEAMIDERD